MIWYPLEFKGERSELGSNSIQYGADSHAYRIAPQLPVNNEFSARIVLRLTADPYVHVGRFEIDDVRSTLRSDCQTYHICL